MDGPPVPALPKDTKIAKLRRRAVLTTVGSGPGPAACVRLTFLKVDCHRTSEPAPFNTVWVAETALSAWCNAGKSSAVTLFGAEDPPGAAAAAVTI